MVLLVCVSPDPRLPTATIEGARLTVRNVHDFSYPGEGGVTERWETRTYDLDELVGLDIFVSYELGTVNTSIGLDELKRRSDITARAREVDDGAGFSRAIREGLPSRPEADRQLATPG